MGAQKRVCDMTTLVGGVSVTASRTNFHDAPSRVSRMALAGAPTQCGLV